MAEFCIDCWNEMNKTNDKEKDYYTTWGLCEGCGECKTVVILKKKKFSLYKLLTLNYDD